MMHFQLNVLSTLRQQVMHGSGMTALVRCLQNAQVEPLLQGFSYFDLCDLFSSAFFVNFSFELEPMYDALLQADYSHLWRANMTCLPKIIANKQQWMSALDLADKSIWINQDPDLCQFSLDGGSWNTIPLIPEWESLSPESRAYLSRLDRERISKMSVCELLARLIERLEHREQFAS